MHLLLDSFCAWQNQRQQPSFSAENWLWFLLHGKNNKTLSQAEEAAPEALHLTGLSAD